MFHFTWIKMTKMSITYSRNNICAVTILLLNFAAISREFHLGSRNFWSRPINTDCLRVLVLVFFAHLKEAVAIKMKFGSVARKSKNFQCYSGCLIWIFHTFIVIFKKRSFWSLISSTLVNKHVSQVSHVFLPRPRSRKELGIRVRFKFMFLFAFSPSQI